MSEHQNAPDPAAVTPAEPPAVDPTTAAPGPGVAAPGVAPAGTPVADYDEAGVPTFDHVRDKIEGRFARAAGSTELAEETPQARSLEEQQASRDRAARERLEEIRRSLGGKS